MNTVPFHEAQLPTVGDENTTVIDTTEISLRDGRIVAVAALSNGGRSFVFQRPTTDGKISSLEFGLSWDSCLVLEYILRKLREDHPTEFNLVFVDDEGNPVPNNDPIAYSSGRIEQFLDQHNLTNTPPNASQGPEFGSSLMIIEGECPVPTPATIPLPDELKAISERWDREKVTPLLG